MTWNDLINQSFVDLETIQPGETITATMQADAQTRLNQLLSSLSTEGLTVFTQVSGSWALTAGQTNYTLGPGGTLNTSARAQRATSWRASYGGVLNSGGRVLSLEEFGAAAQAAQPAGETAPIPKIVGADTSYPLINLRVLPPPSSTPGTLEVNYWTPITQIADFTAAITGLPEGWTDMLHFNLAVRMPQYSRQGGINPVLAAAAQNSKASIVQQNTTTATPAAAPQQ